MNGITVVCFWSNVLQLSCKAGTISVKVSVNGHVCLLQVPKQNLIVDLSFLSKSKAQ